MGELRAAILGAGLMGRWHVFYLRRNGIPVAAVIDSDLDRARHLGRRCSRAPAAPDLRTAMARQPFEVVHVCTPVASHAAAIEAALAEGKHVLCEKPVACSPVEGRALLQAAESRGLVLGAVHQFPFQRGFRGLRQRMEQLGEPVRITLRICSAGGEGRGPVERQAILVEMLPHAVSVFRALSMADIAFRVERRTADDLELGGERGATRLEVSLSLRGRPIRNELTVLGTHGTAVLDLFHGYCVFEPGKVSRSAKILRPFRHGWDLIRSAGTNLIGRAVRGEPAYPGLRELIAAFYRAVRNHEPFPAGREEMVEAARLIEQARRHPAA